MTDDEIIALREGVEETAALGYGSMSLRNASLLALCDAALRARAVAAALVEAGE